MAQYALGKPLGYQQITATGAAASLTVPKGTTTALIAVSVAAIRFRDDGTAPTATVGFPLAIGINPFCYSGNVSDIQIIAQTGSPVVDITYYGD